MTGEELIPWIMTVSTFVMVFLFSLSFAEFLLKNWLDAGRKKKESDAHTASII